MKKICKTFVFSIIVVLFFLQVCFADNPIIQTKFTADPAPMVYDDTVYLYTGHDEDDATSFKMLNWLLYSSTDMANWTDHGIVVSLQDISWANDNGAWAAQCIYRNGKFYYYVTVQLKGIGVLVSDSPYGPFTDPLGRALIPNWDDIDPTAFIDDDGQAYLYWGNPNCYYVKLNEDMISYSGDIVEISSKPQDYQEGPWLHKRDNNYYLSYSSTCCPEGIGYAMSNSPTGPWTWMGKIMDPNSTSSGNQPGIIDFMGTTYCFGFNYDLNWALTTEHRERRSVCVDIMNYNADDTIVKMPWWSTSGPPQIGTLNPYDQTEAETICWEEGVETEVCSEGGMNVYDITNGDWIKVKGVDFGNGATSFDARVASAASGGNIEIRLDSVTGTLVGNCSVSGTGGWQDWVTETCTISGASGLHDLYFVFTGGSGTLFNFNWWKFYGGAETTPMPDLTPAPTPIPPQQEPIWSGGPYTLNGTTDYVDLPDGLTDDLGDFSVACRVNLNSLDTWTRIYDFGGDTNIFMMLTPASGITGYPYFCITLTGNSGEQGLNGPGVLPTGSDQYFAITKSGSTAILYINGQEVDRNTNMTLNPADMGNTLNNYIGRSQWEQDPYLDGEVDEFFIYNRAISASEVTDLANSSEITPEPTATPATGTLGDVNGDGSIDIVDALLIAQYYVNLDPANFVPGNADVNCDGNIDIVDALLIAQYYVGLINGFC